MAKSRFIVNRAQIENLYRVNGLHNFKLRNHEDLLRTHGINVWATDGYGMLSDEKRSIFDKFIVNFCNAQGLESRATLIPKGIYWVEERQYLVKESPEDNFYTVAGSIVWSIAPSGSKTILHKWIHKDYRNSTPILSEKSRFYLRFEYRHQGRNEWLHITNENSWY